MNIVVFTTMAVVLIFIFMVAVSKAAARLDTAARKYAPENLRDATQKEKDFFCRHYIQVGRNTGSEKYKKELHAMSENMKIAEGVLEKLNIDNGYHSDGISAVQATTADININGEVFGGLNVMVRDGENHRYTDKIPTGSEMLIFCALNDENKYKIITCAESAAVND